MAILENLGLTEDSDWQELAACGGMASTKNGPEAAKEAMSWFFEKYESDLYTAQAVDKLCMNCPVQKQCGEVAQATQSEGVWGGIYWDARGTVDKKRNKHKSAEDWKKLYKVFPNLRPGKK